MIRYRVNRKKRRDESLFPSPLAGLLILAALLALSYLWLCGRCDAISREIQALEEQYTELRRRVVAEEYRWAQLNTLSRIRSALDRFGIPMERPDERRIVRLARPLPLEEWEPIAAPQLVLQPIRGDAAIP